MADIALFIEEQYIKDNTVVNGNVDSEYIKSAILTSQKLYIRPILGTALYNEISTQINNDTVSSDNQTLLDDYITDCLMYYTVATGISYFTYKIENKSIVKKDSDNSTPIDSQEVSALRQENLDLAQEFGQLAIDFLQANADADTYAAYLNPGTTSDTIIPRDNDYRIGWTLE